MPLPRCGYLGPRAMLDDDIVKAAEQLLAICKRKNLLVATWNIRAFGDLT